jgi:hypothetical protein
VELTDDRRPENPPDPHGAIDVIDAATELAARALVGAKLRDEEVLCLGCLSKDLAQAFNLPEPETEEAVDRIFRDPGPLETHVTHACALCGRPLRCLGVRAPVP